MKRKAITTIMTVLFLTFTVMTLTLMSVPGVSAQPNKPLTCEVYAELNFELWRWEGYITGDIEGSLIIWPKGASFPGETEHYKEIWEITTVTGKVFIFQEGVWNFKSFRFRSNGMVIDATEEWTYLIGSNAHVNGVTSPFPATEVWFVDCTLRIYPKS